VVQATPKDNLSIVNGMSYCSRNSKWANSAIVAGFSITELFNREVTPSESLDWLESIENKFFELTHSYDLPANRISDFLEKKVSMNLPDTSYDFSLFPFNFSEVFDDSIIHSLRKSMKSFCKKIDGFSEGIMLGLESKTSSPIQAIREKNGKSAGFENIFYNRRGQRIFRWNNQFCR